MRLQRRFFALLSLLALLSPDAVLHAAPAADHVMVPMRDKVKLATDVYLPANHKDEQLPVILVRTPYNKDDEADVGEFYSAHGYAVVIQDTRGRYRSQGQWHFLSDEGKDGADTCAWIAQQKWSNGKIGMYGISYDGGAEHAVALEHSPYLKTVVPIDSASDMGLAGLRNHGAFELRFWNWIHLYGLEGSHEARDPKMKEIFQRLADNRKSYLSLLPLKAGATPLKFAPEYESWLIDAMKHGANDEYWSYLNILENPDRYQDIPVYFVGGWYDSWAGNTVANFVALNRILKSPVYLIMGPWTHGGQESSEHGQVSFGKDAAFGNSYEWLLTWYDHWLKDEENDVGKKQPFASRIRIFVMGTGDGKKTANGLLQHGGFWRDEQEWPLARAKYTNYCLQREGRLSPSPQSDQPASLTYRFDPRDPVPSIGGNVSSHDGLLLQGAYDQRGNPQVWNFPQPVPLSSRRDVMVFQTEPLTADMEVTGPLSVILYASSSQPDTDFTAKLLDVYPASNDYPDGFDLNIADGIIRARFRESLKKESLMQPGKIYPFTIELYPTSNVFKKGHRIRLDISSSNFPRFDVNPNTGEPLNDNHHVAVATNTIYFDHAHQSCIVLPIIPDGPNNPSIDSR